MKPFNLIALIVFFCCCFSAAGAQEYSYKHYETKDGLAGNRIYQTAQDQEGFLWFATETGVSRFDGTNFKNFTTTEGLPDNEILKFFIDSKNRVWMMPFKNAICYYYKGKIYNAENDSTLKKLKITDRVVEIFEDGAGNIFFFENFVMRVLRPDNSISQISNAATNTIFYGGGTDKRKVPYVFINIPPGHTKLYKVIVGHSTLSLEKVNDSIKFNGNKWNYSYINSQLFVYLNNYDEYSDNRHLVFNDYNKHHIDTLLLPPDFNLISFLNDSILFFNTGHGAMEYNYRSHIYKDKFLDDEDVSCTFYDNGDNLWFTTLGNGIYRLRSRINKNIIFSNNKVNRSVESVLVADSKIFVGTNDAKIFEIIKMGSKIVSLRDIHADIGKVIKFMSANGKTYLLCEYFFYEIDFNSAKTRLIPIYENPLLKYVLKDVEINKSSEFFLATHMGVFSFSEENKKYSDLLDQRATSICLVDSGIFIGGLAGLKFVNWKKQGFDLGEHFPVLKDRITKLLLYNNKVWIGTNDNGVVCFNGQKIERKISIENGLTSNLIRALYADSNNLWVGTDRGLNKIRLTDTANKLIQQYTISDGLLSNMINTVFVQHDTVYVGTPKGLSFFDDREMHSNSICKLKILDITVSGKSMQFDSSKLFLKNRDNNIRFDFVALSFKSEGNILYYYKLSGIDADWKTTRENFLQYPTLPSGQYDLQLYAMNKFGIKSEILTIDFEIEKKLVEKTWFLVLIILVSIGIAVLLASLRISGIKNSQKVKTANAEKIAELEQQALKAQMNPHFIFNCLNSIQQYVIDKDVQGANKFITGFSKLIRQTLDNSGKQSITVAEEESFLRSYLELEKSRFEEKFDYNISIDQYIKKDEDSLPPMLLQPYIENCIRHGIMHKSNGKGIIDIQFNLSGRKLICSVTDNGIGRVAANSYKGVRDINHLSKGTDITWQRIKMINKNNDPGILLQTDDLMDSNQQPCGTKVTVVIPLQKAD